MPSSTKPEEHNVSLEEDRATATDSMHKNLWSLAVRFSSYARESDKETDMLITPTSCEVIFALL